MWQHLNKPDSNLFRDPNHPCRLVVSIREPTLSSVGLFPHFIPAFRVLLLHSQGSLSSGRVVGKKVKRRQ
jgi:hypothetical protein